MKILYFQVLFEIFFKMQSKLPQECRKSKGHETIPGNTVRSFFLNSKLLMSRLW